jgi:hypothetical protein
MIDRGELGRLSDRIGAGGQSKVFRVPRSSRFPYEGVLYKEYLPQVVKQLDSAVLLSMVEFQSALADAEREWLFQASSWPLCLVNCGAVPVGFLMLAADAKYHIAWRNADGSVVRELAKTLHLLNSDRFLSVHGLAVTDRERYNFLAAAAETLHRLHRYQIMVGDFSGRNLLFDVGVSCDAYFIDCDSMSFRGRSALTPVETPFWDIRSIYPTEQMGTVYSDTYKFSLLGLRLFARDNQARSASALPGTVAASVRSLIAAGVSGVPSNRPLPGMWIDPLKRAAAQAKALRRKVPNTPLAAQSQSGVGASFQPQPTTPAVMQNPAVPLGWSQEWKIAFVAACVIVPIIVIASLQETTKPTIITQPQQVASAVSITRAVVAQGVSDGQPFQVTTNFVEPASPILFTSYVNAIVNRDHMRISVWTGGQEITSCPEATLNYQNGNYYCSVTNPLLSNGNYYFVVDVNGRTVGNYPFSVMSTTAQSQDIAARAQAEQQERERQARLQEQGEREAQEQQAREQQEQQEHERQARELQEQQARERQARAQQVPQVLITMVNRNCRPLDLYLNNRRVATVQANSLQQFAMPAGTYITKTCIANTSTCGQEAAHTMDTANSTVTYSRDPTCQSVNRYSLSPPGFPRY